MNETAQSKMRDLMLEGNKTEAATVKAYWAAAGRSERRKAIEATRSGHRNMSDAASKMSWKQLPADMKKELGKVWGVKVEDAKTEAMSPRDFKNVQSVASSIATSAKELALNAKNQNQEGVMWVISRLEKQLKSLQSLARF